jgi:hypothetical protein
MRSRRQNGLSRVATLLAWLCPVLAACAACSAPAATLTPAANPTSGPSPTPTFQSTSGPPGTVDGFSIGYDNGSVPPPFSYTYTLDGTFAGDALDVHYVLTYRFRDELTPAEITENGYTDHDDINWTGHLTGDAAGAWRSLLAATTLGPIPPLAPGSESFTVSLHVRGADDLVGVPLNRDAWQSLIMQLDQQARAETGSPRSAP